MAKRPEPGRAELLAHWIRSAPHKAASFLTHIADFSIPLREEELAAADRITNVVLPLGPYRNLTTMTAALFALHPQSVVLNHAAMRVFGTRFDPFDDLSPERWRAFKAASTRLLRQWPVARFERAQSIGSRTGKMNTVWSLAASQASIAGSPASKRFWKRIESFQNRVVAAGFSRTSPNRSA